MLYFNDNDAHAARWLKNLYPDAKIDDRSICDVQPAELREFQRCHFFGGIGVWEYALGLAGWPAATRVFTGSCPCQPFSAAGAQKGTADARHLWPEFCHLIAESEIDFVFGEQVASKAGRAWLGGVQIDLEKLDFAVGASDLCAASAGILAEGRFVCGDSSEWRTIRLGAPHIRQRLFWVAVSNGWLARHGGIQSGREYGQQSQDGGVGGLWHAALSGERTHDGKSRADDGREGKDRGPDLSGGLADGGCLQRERWQGEFLSGEEVSRQWLEEKPDDQRSGTDGNSADSRLGITEGLGDRSPSLAGGDCQGEGVGRVGLCGGPSTFGRPSDADDPRPQGRRSAILPERAGEPLAGPQRASYWANCDIIPCADAKSRRIESGLQPLVNGHSFMLADGRTRENTSRTEILRGIGNCIVPQVAAEFIAAFMEIIGLEPEYSNANA